MYSIKINIFKKISIDSESKLIKNNTPKGNYKKASEEANPKGSAPATPQPSPKQVPTQKIPTRKRTQHMMPLQSSKNLNKPKMSQSIAPFLLQIHKHSNK